MAGPTMNIHTLSDSIIPRHRQRIRGPHRSQSLDENEGVGDLNATRVRHKRGKRNVRIACGRDYTVKA